MYKIAKLIRQNIIINSIFIYVNTHIFRETIKPIFKKNNLRLFPLSVLFKKSSLLKYSPL